MTLLRRALSYLSLGWIFGGSATRSRKPELEPETRQQRRHRERREDKGQIVPQGGRKP